MNSTRLPGKVLADVGGRSMLTRVIERVRLATCLHGIVVATGNTEADQPIADQCWRLGLPCFRGSPEDVLDRYWQAATKYGAEAVVRITADCPLIHPLVIDRVIRAFLASRADYASNTLERTWPRGYDTEVMTIGTLEIAWREATTRHEREHVTPFIYRHPERFTLHSVTSPKDMSGVHCAVDTPRDLEFVRRVYAQLATGDE